MGFIRLILRMVHFNIKMEVSPLIWQIISVEVEAEWH